MRLSAIAAVFALNVALAGGLVYVWSDDGRVRWKEPVAMAPALDEGTEAPLPELADVARYRETIERPLFAMNRKRAPRGDAADGGQAAVDVLKDVRLVGTYGAGARGGIIVVNGGAIQRIGIGERIGEWKVAESQGRSVALIRANGERRQLELALNTTTPALPSTVAKGEGGPDAGKAAPPEAAGVPVPTQPVTPRPASATPAGGQNDAEREARLRQRVERINAARARRGLRPIQN